MNFRISSGWGTRGIRRRRSGPLSEGSPQHLQKNDEKQNAENAEPHNRREPQQRVMLDFSLQRCQFGVFAPEVNVHQHNDTALQEPDAGPVYRICARAWRGEQEGGSQHKADQCVQQHNRKDFVFPFHYLYGTVIVAENFSTPSYPPSRK